ncbi:hypothetical protein SUDANB178_02882 [Streptomyces sp. enrichment culture]
MPRKYGAPAAYVSTTALTRQHRKSTRQPAGTELTIDRMPIAKPDSGHAILPNPMR